MIKHESLLAIPFGFLIKFILLIDTLSERLMIHDNNFTVFFLTLCLMPILIYLVKNIPLKYAVYEASTMQKLDTYNFQLERLRFSYDKLARMMSNAAVAKEGTDTVNRTVNNLVDSIMSGDLSMNGLGRANQQVLTQRKQRTSP